MDNILPDYKSKRGTKKYLTQKTFQAGLKKLKADPEKFKAKARKEQLKSPEDNQNV